MIHPHTELQYIDAQIGYGVVATRLIPRGTITWVSDALDQVFPPEQKPALPALLQDQLDTYSFRNSDGNYILCWDHARFVNHSCRANCLSADFNCEVAVRDIPPGEELTDDYGTLNIESSFACACRQPRCRNVIRPDDVLAYGPLWDGLLQQSLPFLSRVAQPLWPLIESNQKLRRVLAGEVPVPSLVEHYCRLNPATILNQTQP
jgi:uncharacterized protein